MLVVVPNYLRDAINTKIDAAIIEYPPIEAERERLFGELLVVYNNYGHLNCSILPKQGDPPSLDNKGDTTSGKDRTDSEQDDQTSVE